MKSILLFSALLFVFQARSQRGYFSFKVSYPLAGTPRELKSGMRASGFDNSTTLIFSKDYPNSVKYPSVVVEGGRYINEKISVSLLAGLQEAGIVKGYNTNRGGITINYTNYVVNPKINFHRKSAILGIGPSALLLLYKKPPHQFGDYNHSKLLPGVSLSAESVSKKKRGFRFGVFSTLNLHPGFKIEHLIINSTYTQIDFQSSLNPSALNLGFRFQF
ncbi:MAG: hypothetical protein ABIQ00_13840 [Chitinophagaceae bacterium]